MKLIMHPNDDKHYAKFWDNLAKGMVSKKPAKKKTKLSNKALIQNSIDSKTASNHVLPKRVIVTYKYGEQQKTIYFTKRETECMQWFLKNSTTNEVAEKLKLSPRTIEDHIRNMKAKVGCHTKKELVKLIHASDFLQNI